MAQQSSRELASTNREPDVPADLLRAQFGNVTMLRVAQRWTHPRFVLRRQARNLFLNPACLNVTLGPRCVSGPISKGVSFAGEPSRDFSLRCLLIELVAQRQNLRFERTS
jgi:hypothetical protein